MIKTIRISALLSTSIAACGAIAPVTVYAQEAVRTSSTDEIIVTARRTNERLQDVPLAVTAVGGEALQRENITSVADLGRIAPGLNVTPGPSAGKSTPSFAIRGLSQQETSIVADPSVPVYFGDIVAARPQGLNQALYDIGAVEVLRGPQGTLFGRNTTGGAVVIRPNAPTDVLEGEVSVTVGNLGTVNVDGFINIPLGEKAQLRLAGARTTDDGYIYDTILSRNINYTDTWSGRASLRLLPSDQVESLFVFSRFVEDDGGKGGYVNSINPAGNFNSPAARAARNYPTLESLLADQQARGYYDTASGVPMSTNVKTWDIANTTTIKLSDAISVRNIIGYRKVFNSTIEDTDGMPIPLLHTTKRDNVKQFTEELHLLGNVGDLNFITGLFYFHEKGRNGAPAVTGGVDPGNLEPSDNTAFPNWSLTDVQGKNISYAAFLQGTYALDSVVEGLSVTGGIRYNRDERNAVIRNRNATTCRFTLDNDGNPATPEVNPGLAGCELALSKTFDEPTYNVSLEWKANADTLLYAAHRHGYRSGGFGARASTQAGLERSFLPETVDDIEVGVKRDWRIGESFLRTNLALFRADYKDIQRLLVDSTTAPVTTVPVNAGSAVIKGAELEVLFRPIPQLELSGFYSYTKTKFKEFLAPDGTDLSGSRFARAPKHLLNLSARVTVLDDDANGKVTVGGNYFYSSSYAAQDDVLAPALEPSNIFPSYSIVNFNGQWERPFGTDLDVSVFVNNALGKKYSFPHLQVIGLGFDARTPAPPRTYGVRLSYKFGR